MAKSRSRTSAVVTPITTAGPDAAKLPPRAAFRVSESAVMASRVRPPRSRDPVLRALGQRTFKPAAPMPGVLPSGTKPRFAQDEVPVLDYASWASDTYFNSMVAEGTTFLGYAYLAALSQRGEYRVVSETLASEATREWIEIKSTGDDKTKAKAITKILNEFERLEVQEICRVGVEQDGLFGRSHIYFDTGDTDDEEELCSDLGCGRDAKSRAKVTRDHPLLALRTVEPMWTYPNRYNSTNPLQETWYRPETWFVMGREIHHSRFYTLVGRPVADSLKPAYAFGGLAASQMLKPYVDNWLRTRQAVSDLVHSFSVNVLKTNLDLLMGPGSEEALFRRVDLFNNLRDNRGTLVLDKDGEDYAAVQTSLGTLDQLQAQAQEQMAAMAHIPIVKLFGIDPHGLNASSEGSLRTFYDWLEGFRKRLLLPLLRRVLDFVQLSLFGQIDPDLAITFKSLWQLDEATRATLQQTKATTHEIYADRIGAVSAEEVRDVLRNDKDSLYAGLELLGEAPGPPAVSAEMPGVPGIDPLTPPEDDPVTDNCVDGWRKKAASLFADEEEIDYWRRRAETLFAGNVPSSRWAALAAKLAETTNEYEPVERWERRARHWADRAAEIRAAAEADLDEPLQVVLPDGENIVDREPVSPFLETGSSALRWDNPDEITSVHRQSPIRSRTYQNAAANIIRNIAKDSPLSPFSDNFGREE